jgi:hypothetical protein
MNLSTAQLCLYGSSGVCFADLEVMHMTRENNCPVYHMRWHTQAALPCDYMITWIPKSKSYQIDITREAECGY